MGGRRGGLTRRLQGQPVLAGGEDVLDGVEAAGAEGDGAGARGVEPGVAVLPPSRMIPSTALYPCSGWGRLSRIRVTSSPVAGPTFSAQRMRRDGVHSAWARWALGMCSATVDGCPS